MKEETHRVRCLHPSDILHKLKALPLIAPTPYIQLSINVTDHLLTQVTLKVTI